MLRLIKFVPTLVVLCVTVSALLPFLQDSSQAAGEKKEASAIKDLLKRLTKRTVPLIGRDPFMLGSSGSPGSAGATGGKPGTGVLGTGSNSKSAEDSRGIAPDPTLAELTQDMKLTATYVDGKRGFAIINDKIYEVGDRLMSPDESPTPIRLTRVDHHKVHLSLQRKSVVLTYSDVPREAEAPAPEAEQPQGIASLLGEGELGLVQKLLGSQLGSKLATSLGIDEIAEPPAQAGIAARRPAAAARAAGSAAPSIAAGGDPKLYGAQPARAAKASSARGAAVAAGGDPKLYGPQPVKKRSAGAASGGVPAGADPKLYGPQPKKKR